MTLSGSLPIVKSSFTMSEWTIVHFKMFSFDSAMCSKPVLRLTPNNRLMGIFWGGVVFFAAGSELLVDAYILWHAPSCMYLVPWAVLFVKITPVVML